ncbi:MAG: sigma-54-dependent Fis family transcriptional regulator [Planctomycetes bacterium]|nr:sigma-54-dependent Fis family transcriptional regulator [Planctomycetota bacterium]
MKILLADDEKSITVTLTDDLVSAGYAVTTVDDGNKACDAVKKERFDCLITDIKMPGIQGTELVKFAKQAQPDIFIILITAYGTIQSAVEAIKDGAYDYIQKPFMNEEILLRLEKISQLHRLSDECRRLKEELSGKYAFGNIIGKSKKMQEVFEFIKVLSASDCNVLIEGDTGTGKKLVASAIHYNSARKNNSIVTISCAMPETLIEDELFGHEKGAFTGANAMKIGRFERAHQGTIFIDDIDDLPVSTQVKLLKVIEEKTFERLGGTKSINVDTRIIAATKVDLQKAVKESSFREDLFYRLNVVTVKLPTLRERIDDIPLLCSHFIKTFGKGRDFAIPAETLLAMETYPWHGNVRELENAVQRAITLAGDSLVLKKEHLMGMPAGLPAVQTTLEAVLDGTEANYIKFIVEQNNGNRNKSAEILGISRKTLWEKMTKYNIK